MKKVVLAFLLATPAAQATVLETCQFELKIEQTTTEGDVVVQQYEDGTQEGLLKFDGNEIIRSNEIEITEYAHADLKQFFRDTSAGSLAQGLELSLKDLDSAKAVLIDPEGLRDDATGVAVISFYDASKSLIAKIVQAGWSAAICK